MTEPTTADRRGPRGGVQVRRIEDAGDLATDARAWNRLAERQAHPLPFNTYAWVSALVEHRVRPGARWVCLQAWRGSELIGVLPLIHGQRRRLGIPGTVAATPADDQTQFLDLIAAPGEEAEAIPALVGAAIDSLPGCLLVEFPMLREDSATLLHATTPDRAWRASRSPAGTGAYLPIGGEFPAYRASLSRNFRSNLNKAANKLARADGVAYRFHRATGEDEGDLDAFMAAEAASWKGDAGTAILCSEALVRFYRTLTRRLAEAGWLEWQSLHVGGRVIASNLAVMMGSRMIIWKLGYDAHSSRLSPGSLLMERVIERSHEDGVTEIDLLTEYPWYDNWRMARRSYEFLQVFPRSMRASLVTYAPHLAGRLARAVPGVVPAGRAIRGAMRRLQSRLRRS